MLKISPAILIDDVKEAISKIETIEDVLDRHLKKHTDHIQIDIVDGIFAGNITIVPEALRDVDTSLYLDFQLMVREPVDWVERCVNPSTDRIIGHIEQMSDQVEFVKKVQSLGCKVGLALDIKTPVYMIDPTILTNLDTVLVLSVPAGFGGQTFDKRAINKIKQLDEIRARDDTPYTICDDGGITFEYIDDLRLAGVDEVAIGEKIYKGDLRENIENFIKRAYDRR
ncbi:hypothetical protein A2961_02215 [Candidatus Woesebacteria bacterium RIFCSPLOWO2_01_FULL_39_21]|uniref:Ribulose-phosphate 3-epimerase n=1 Tax=Candidatus Woesebacteria bacterium RIFCSPLOWO2_01_FULL_39_21 TaxID=1802519 RepID=A0A1F8BBA0_9BACT|nr:MAG: hypothetical protein A2691_00630 [Candidatus Woesebacteria bacterium RIFCSPHIGHO2_01_FULL_39_23]OGM61322.1 MAG: hypothetical protein A2961_02215 [Candidatus Woesebacteria bacterium RIFCSPLOWO2_01_FULL_39_21]